MFIFHSVAVLTIQTAERLRILSDLQRDELLALKRAPGTQDVPSLMACQASQLHGFTKTTARW